MSPCNAPDRARRRARRSLAVPPLVALLAFLGAPQAAQAQSPFHAKEYFPGQSVQGRARTNLGEGTTYELRNAPSWLSIDPGTGAISGTLPQGAAPVAGISVRATKKEAVAESPLFSLQVGTPTAAVMGGNGTFVEGNPVSLSGTTNLPGASWTLSGGPAWLGASGNVFSGTHTGDITETQTWTVRVRAESGGAAVEQAFPLSVVPATTSAALAPASVFAGQAVSGSASSTLGAGASFSLVNAPDWLGINASTGALSGTAAGSASGIVVRATKNGAVADSPPLSVAAATPTASVAGSNSSIVEGNAFTMSGSTNLPRPTWTLSGGPDWLTVNGGTFSGTHTGDISAQQSWTVTATATDAGASTSATFPVTVVPASTTASLASTSVFSGQTVTGSASTTLGAGASFSLVNAPAWLGINASTGAISGTATSSASNVVVRATKNGAVATSSAMSVSVTAPTASATGPSVYEGGWVSFTATSNLPSPTWSLVGAPAWLSINAAGTVSGSATAPGGTYYGTARASKSGAVADAPFAVTVVPHDTTPDAFALTALSGQEPWATVYSNQVWVTGITTPVAVNTSGPGAQVSVAGGAWTTSTTIANGQPFTMRMTASGSYLTTQSSWVSVGGLSRQWNVTTRGPLCNGGGDNVANAEHYYFYSADVKNAGWNAYIHWAFTGWAENRPACYTLPHCEGRGDAAPNSAVNRELYLTWNDDVRRAGVDPYQHWLNYGRYERRSSCWM